MDSIAVTPGSGALVATDDVGGVNVEIVKLDGGGDGLSVPIIAGQQAMAASVPVVIASNQTAVPVSQSGTWTVQPGNTANTTAWKVDGSAVTQPVSGTVTANAGTNLNTSALAIEAGNLATLAAATHLEDSGFSDLDRGIGVQAIRKATPANTSGTDGDYEFLQISAGRLWASATIDAALPAGTNAIGKLAANSGVDIGDVDITSIAAGDNNIGNVDIVTVPTDPFGANADAASATGSISAKLRFIAATGIPVTNTVTVGTHAVTVASGGVASGAIASGAVASGAIASGAFASGSVGSGAIASGAVASGAVASGAFASGALASGSVSDGAVVTLGAKADAKSTATDTTAITIMQVAKQISASAQLCDASLGVMDDWDNTASDGCSVTGDVANDGVDAGEPVKIGGQARTTNPTAVADADRVNAIFDKLGKQITVGAIREMKGRQKTTLSNTTTETTIVTAVASTFLDLYGLILANTGATTTKVSIRDDTAGSVQMDVEVPTLETRGFMLPVDSATPQTATNKNWTAQCASATTALEVTAFFVKNT